MSGFVKTNNIKCTKIFNWKNLQTLLHVCAPVWYLWAPLWDACVEDIENYLTVIQMSACIKKCSKNKTKMISFLAITAFISGFTLHSTICRQLHLLQIRLPEF